MPPKEMDARIDRALALVGLSGFRKRTVTTLSGGQKQKLAIASALVMDAELLLLDEPSALLDANSRAEIMALLNRLVQEEHKTILLVEHNLDEVLPFVGYVVVLNRDGSLALQGSAHDVFARLAYDTAFAALPVCLPEPLMLLREWLHDNPSDTQQSFCREQLAIRHEGAFSVPYSRDRSVDKQRTRVFLRGETRRNRKISNRRGNARTRLSLSPATRGLRAACLRAERCLLHGARGRMGRHREVQTARVNPRCSSCCFGFLRRQAGVSSLTAPRSTAFLGRRSTVGWDCCFKTPNGSSLPTASKTSCSSACAIPR